MVLRGDGQVRVQDSTGSEEAASVAASATIDFVCDAGMRRVAGEWTVVGRRAPGEQYFISVKSAYGCPIRIRAAAASEKAVEKQPPPAPPAPEPGASIPPPPAPQPTAAATAATAASVAAAAGTAAAPAPAPARAPPPHQHLHLHQLRHQHQHRTCTRARSNSSTCRFPQKTGVSRIQCLNISRHRRRCCWSRWYRRCNRQLG